jgi:hypothetical protein
VGKKLRGLLVDVLRCADGRDCTAGGVTSRVTKAVLVEDDCELGPFEPDERAPALRFVVRNVRGRRCVHAEPIDQPIEGKVGPMFGGNYVTSSDGRFPSDYPIPVHDRFETPGSGQGD